VSFLVERLINLLLLDRCVCGFAAFRVESLRLSVRALKKERLRLGRRSRQNSCGSDGKPEAFRTGGSKAASQSEIRAAESEVNGK